MKVVNGVKVMIKRMKREAKELQMRFTNHQGIGRKNRRLFFPAFILGI